MTIDIAVDHLGYSHGQHDFQMNASVDGSVAGHLAFCEFEGVPHVQLIEVADEHRRRGIALAMMAALQERYPERTIALGTLVEDGPDFFAAVPFLIVRNEEYDEAMEDLEEERTTLDLFVEIADLIRRSGDPDGALVRQLAQWNRVSDHVEELERFLELAPHEFRYVDVDAARERSAQSFAKDSSNTLN